MTRDGILLFGGAHEICQAAQIGDFASTHPEPQPLHHAHLQLVVLRPRLLDALPRVLQLREQLRGFARTEAQQARQLGTAARRQAR
eukprot:scaffold141238_cov130-Phaeocystis_antarctica.AAC.1